MHFITVLSVGISSAWLAGINLYATVGTLGLLERFDVVRLPGGLEVLGEWWVIALAGVLYLMEFFADKIPSADLVWNAVHTFIRVPAGAVLALSAFAYFDPAVRVVALLAGGGVALAAHGSKAAVRLAASGSPEPFTSVALSFFEDSLAIGFSLLMVFHPLVVLGAVLVFVGTALWLMPKVVRALGVLLGRMGRLVSVGQDSAPIN
jgi:hypothetical protein